MVIVYWGKMQTNIHDMMQSFHHGPLQNSSILLEPTWSTLEMSPK